MLTLLHLLPYLACALALLAYLSPAPADAAHLFGIHIPILDDVIDAGLDLVPGGNILRGGLNVAGGLLGIGGGGSAPPTGAGSQIPPGINGGFNPSGGYPGTLPGIQGIPGGVSDDTEPDHHSVLDGLPSWAPWAGGALVLFLWMGQMGTGRRF